MPSKKAIFYLILGVILLVLMFFLFIMFGMSEIARIHPYLFDWAESVRCRFEMSVCLSLYPNPAREGEKVTATLRTQIFYDRSWVCLVRNYNEFVDKCQINKESCKITFEAKPGKYYAFINVNDCEHNLIPSDKQAKSKDTELVTVLLIPII